MIDHVTLNVADVDAAKAFYEAALRPVGYELAMDFVGGAGFAADGKPDFFLAERGEPSSPVHVAFKAADRKTVDAFNRGDFDAALKPAHPDVEWVTLDSFPDAGIHRGPEGLRQFFSTWMDMFQGFRLHLEDCVALNQDLVLATVRVSGEGTESGVQVESPIFFQLAHFRDGLAIRVQMFHTKSEALEAAGVSE